MQNGTISDTRPGTIARINKAINGLKSGGILVFKAVTFKI
jgi:hypothetical protein